MVIFKELKELRQNLQLQQIENGKKQERIVELNRENRELKEQNKHLEKQLEQALKDYDKLMEVANDRKHNTTKQTHSKRSSR